MSTVNSCVERPRCQCALGGALVTLNSINRAAAIVHASPGCAATADAAASQGGGYWGTTANNGRATPSTNMLEREIVFGGEERLAEQIGTTLEVVDADLFGVITGCMTDIIGDDVKAVVSKFQSEGKPLVYAETGGFKGTSADGYDMIWRAFSDQYVEKGLPRKENLVNILGLIPTQDVFWRGNLLEVRRLLEKLGIEANTFLTSFDDLSALRRSSQASLNIVFSDTLGRGAAQHFEDQHGIPFVTLPLPIGPSATERFLRAVVERLGVGGDRVEQVIAEEARGYYSFVEHLADLYNDQDFQRFGVIVATEPYAFALTRFISEDLNWIPFATVVTDLLDESQVNRVRSRFAELPSELHPRLIFESDTSRIADKVLEQVAAEYDPYGEAISPAFVLGSSLDRPLAAALKAGFWGVSYPVVNRVVTDQGYYGYRGGLRLVTEILSVLVSNR
jgi:nitrogenase molybdenum-iron protein beta chain